MPAKEAPATMMAGSTSPVSRQPTWLRTSQSGKMRENGARIRPVMADSCISGRPVTPASTRIGLPTAPQATGAVLATRHSVAA